MNATVNTDFWKWGDPHHAVHLSQFPALKTFLEKKFNASLKEDQTDRGFPPVRPPLIHEKEIKQLFPLLKPGQVSADRKELLRFAFGKSYKDIIRILTSKEIAIPGFVLFPESLPDIEYMLKIARENKIKIITFSGGSNVVGAFDSDNSVVTGILSMQRMNRIIEIDELSHTATFETGISGPDLEKALNEKGFTLGHFPQSFEHSTLGGWLAMNSAGQESGLYGNIEDMALWIKTVTPSGIVENIDFPRHACGIDVLRLFIGSEGTLGIITEAKLKIHKKPVDYRWKIALFKNFEGGSEAVRKIIQEGIHPAIIRLSDSEETRLFSLLSQRKKNFARKWVEDVIKSRLKSKGYAEPCLLMMRFAIRNKTDMTMAETALNIAVSEGAQPLSPSVASNWESSRFSLPYLRDTLIRHKILVDTFETVAYWKNLIPLCHHVSDSLKSARFFENGGLLLCHISHVYETGASLYFTMITPQEKANELKQWIELKQAVSEAILEKGGAISHHHGIGKDHQPWFHRQLDPGAARILGTIKNCLDPDDILNPGKLSNA